MDLIELVREKDLSVRERLANDVIVGEAKNIRGAKAQQKLEAKRMLGAELDAKPVPSPTGTFNVIVIDPPWRYHKRTEDTTHRGRSQYPDMSITDIEDLPISERAAENCILWLWTTNAFMHEAYHCLEIWKFIPKTILTWAKDRMGLGDWLRGQTEHCILAIRGKPIVTLTNQATLLDGPVREHSRKPEEFYELVEQLCHGSKLDMFAREQREGWVSWGAETDKF
jgi:N6-adenosine-specific RNA methylase IME4